MDQHQDSVILQTDAKNGFPSVKRKAMATLLLQEAPELLGYFHTCYGQSPLMADVEFDPDSGEHHRRVDYTVDGLLMGEGLASAFFTMQNKLPRIINNARPGCTDKGYIDDFINMCRLGDAIPDYSQHPLAQMLTTTKEHMHTWGNAGHRQNKNTGQQNTTSSYQTTRCTQRHYGRRYSSCVPKRKY